MGYFSDKLNVFDYTDYRRYLGDYYKLRKTSRTKFSYRTFSSEAGFSSPNFIKLVIEGDKNLTAKSGEKIITGLKLEPNEADYFRLLVQLESSKTFESKKKALQEIDHFHQYQKPRPLSSDEYDYLKKWYYPIIRELVVLPDFVEDPKWISKKLQFDLTEKKCAEALSFLIEHEFLIRDAKGKLHKKDKKLSADNSANSDVIALLIKSFHIKCLNMAEKSIVTLPKNKRNVSNTTISLSKKGYETAIQRIKSLRFELLDLASTEEEAEKIYQMNFNLFPLTKD